MDITNTNDVYRKVIKEIKSDTCVCGGIDWKPRILLTWKHTHSILNNLIAYLRTVLPSQLESIKKTLQHNVDLRNEVATRFWESIDIGRFVQNSIGTFITPQLLSNHKSYYPDFLCARNFKDYPKLLRPRRRGVAGCQPALIMGEFVTNVPDGLELKCSSAISENGGFVFAHGPQSGLHLVVSYTKDETVLFNVRQIWIGYVKSKDKILRGRKSESTTIKYVFHTNILIPLL